MAEKLANQFVEYLSLKTVIKLVLFLLLNVEYIILIIMEEENMWELISNILSALADNYAKDTASVGAWGEEERNAGVFNS